MKLAMVWILGLSCLACSSDGDGSGGDPDGAPVVFADSAPPDAFVPVCEGTMCGSECIDTSSDPLNCGGCGMACDSPGQICSGALPCACPAGFVPAELEFPTSPAFNPIQMANGVTIAIGAILTGETFNALLISYDGETAIGEDIALSPETLTPSVAAGYDIDIQAQTAHTAYQVISGTLNLTTACDVGASGTLTNATFVEVTQALPPMVVEGGCQFTLETVAFDIGSACPAP